VLECGREGAEGSKRDIKEEEGGRNKEKERDSVRERP